MASSGTIRNNFTTGYAVQIAWTVDSQSVANNTSSVTAKVQLVSTGSTYTINSSASKSGSLTINGTKYTFTFSAALSGNQTKTIFTKTVTVPHGTDGSKTCSFSCEAGINVTLSGTYFGTVPASGTGVFNTIARASTIASVTASVAINGTNTCAVSITRASSSFTHTVKFSFGSYSYTASNVGTSTSYAIPLTWMNGMPSSTSGTATVTVTTYSGSTKIGTAVSKNFTLTVPSSIVPTISSVTIAEAVSGLAAKFAAYIQNKSKLKVTTSAAGTYSSTIKSYKTTINGVNYSGASITSGTISTSGSVTITITVTDSRGRTATTTRSVTVLAYTAPKIGSFSVYRSNASGVQDYNGSYATVKMNFAITSLNSKNDKSHKVEYKQKSSSTWTQATSGSVYSYNSTLTLTATFSTETSFDIRLTITDYFGSAVAASEIPTAFTLVDFNASGRGLAFGKVSEVADHFEIEMPVDVNNNIFMGGDRRSDDEKNIYFKSLENAAYKHNCKLYGGNGNSVTSIGFFDSLNAMGVFRYLSSTKNLVVDAGVTFTRANGGKEFVTSETMTAADRSGRVRFSNGLLIQWGNVSITPSAANTPTAGSVTFAESYDYIPLVVVTPHSTVPGTTVTGSACSDFTKTGFKAYVTRTNTTATTLGWIAIGMKG